MPSTRVSLVQGAYTARSVISAAQRCLNLYPEKGPAGEDSPSTHYLTPGLTNLGIPPEVDRVRGLYRATNGEGYAAIGSGIYLVHTDWTTTLLGRMGAGWGTDLQIPGANEVSAAGYVFTAPDVGNTIRIISGTGFIPGDYTILSVSIGVATLDANPGLTSSTGGDWVELIAPIVRTPVKMNDNATDMVIVDGSALGWTVNLTSHVMTLITDPDFYGSNQVEEMDTYLLFNKPGTPIFYCSDSNAVTFDPLFFAEKTGYSDSVAGICVQNRNIWVIGNQSSAELWIDSGAADFPFSRMDGPFVQHGAVAIYSIARQGGSVFWLAQDEYGASYVVEVANLKDKKISTPAIEAAIASYPTITDAVGFCYEQQGHAFYWLKFPSANGGDGADWVYDLTTGLWHERGWLNPATCGIELHRVYCAAFFYGVNVAGDLETGQLYMLDPNNPTDAGDFVERRRGYPHMMTDGSRVSYPSFVADMQPAVDVAVATPPPALPVGLINSTVITVIDTTFTAPDGTLLQNYFSPWAMSAGDIGSQYTKISGSVDGEIVGNMLNGSASGAAAYLASGVPTSPDYVSAFQATPGNYGAAALNGGEVYVINRANPIDNGYKLAITGNGTDFVAELTVMGGATSSVVAGLLTLGFFQAYLSTQGTNIDAAVQRSQDGFWLTPAGTWQSAFVLAISLTDAAYTTAGRVIVGGTW